jgi:peptidoglycan L-alanyl-D-glutamate endopeptidase CwlK
MTYALGPRSVSALAGVHPDLVRVVERAIQISAVDFKVIEGVRSDEQAYINYGKGRTAAELSAKGIDPKYAQPHLAKVTWLNDPLATKHRKQADGFGHAADLLPAPYDWKDAKLFDLVATAMFAAAKELGVSIRWGADWDADGKPRERGETDSPHFELAT